MNATENHNPGLIYQKIAKILSEVDAIGKNRQNAQQGYKFRGNDDFLNMLHPLFAAHGVFPCPHAVEMKREERATRNGGVMTTTVITVDVHFYAEDGTYVVARTIGEGMDSGDKSANKAMTAAFKYAVMQVFAIPTEEAIDSEKDSPEPAPRSARPASEKSSEERLPGSGESTTQPRQSASADSPGVSQTQKGTSLNREELNKLLMSIYRPFLKKYPDTKFQDVLQKRYGVAETRLMTTEQLGHLSKWMQSEIDATDSPENAPEQTKIDKSGALPGSVRGKPQEKKKVAVKPSQSVVTPGKKSAGDFNAEHLSTLGSEMREPGSDG